MKNRSVLVAMFVICTAVLALFPFPPTAAAAPSEQWARWYIELAFNNNKPETTMTIEIGHLNRFGNPILDMSETYDVSCYENGSLNIVNNVAEFDGHSYLACEMPVFQDKVSDLTEGKLEVGNECACKIANGSANFNFAGASENPFFYMKGLQFSAPTQANGQVARYQLTVADSTAESETFLPNKQLQWGVGEFSQSGKGYLPAFQVDGAVLGSSPQYIAGHLAVPTNQNEFFIGFNPDTGDTLQGQLNYLFVDPGCVGHGGI